VIKDTHEGHVKRKHFSQDVLDILEIPNILPLKPLEKLFSFALETSYSCNILGAKQLAATSLLITDHQFPLSLKMACYCHYSFSSTKGFTSYGTTDQVPYIQVKRKIKTKASLRKTLAACINSGEPQQLH